MRVTTALTLALAWTPATRHPVVDARAARSRVAAASCFARARASMLAGRRPTKRLAAKAAPADVAREKHLHFDEVEVLARGGHGGHGAVVSLPSRGDGPKLRRTSDDDFELPPGGGHGGDVVLYVDPALSDLLHLRATSTLCAARGGDSLGLRDLAAARERLRELQAEAGVEGLAFRRYENEVGGTRTFLGWV